MSKKTLNKIKGAFFCVATVMFGYKALDLANEAYDKYKGKRDVAFSSEDFSKDVSPEVVELFTRPGSELSFLKDNKKGAALAAKFIDDFRKSYNENDGRMLLRDFNSNVDYGKYGEDYARALDSLPIGYLTNSGIFSKKFSSEKEREAFSDFFNGAVSKTRYLISEANLDDKLVKAKKTWADYADDRSQMWKGSTLQIKKMGVEALGTAANAAVQSRTLGGAIVAVFLNMVRAVLDDNAKQQERQENGGRQ